MIQAGMFNQRSTGKTVIQSFHCRYRMLEIRKLVGNFTLFYLFRQRHREHNFQYKRTLKTSVQDPHPDPYVKVS